MKKALILSSLTIVSAVTLTACGNTSKQSDCEKACENLATQEKSICLSTCQKASEQFDKQAEYTDFDAMNQGGAEPNPDGLDDEMDENETAGVGVTSNGIADGEVVGDTGYYEAEPEKTQATTNDVCDENWQNAECEEVQGQYKDSCYAELANDKSQECICSNKIENTGLKDSCYMSVAEQKEDYTICDYIVSENTQDACYVALAEQTETVEPCNKVNNQTFKDGCYQTVASLTQDISICDMISQSAFQKTCKMELETN